MPKNAEISCFEIEKNLNASISEFIIEKNGGLPLIGGPSVDFVWFVRALSDTQMRMILNPSTCKSLHLIT